MQELVMDILRVLSAPDLEVRKKTLKLALDLVSSRNIEEVTFYINTFVCFTTRHTKRLFFSVTIANTKLIIKCKWNEQVRLYNK